MKFWAEGRLYVSRADQVLAEDGEISDEDLRERLAGFLWSFSAFAERTKSARVGSSQ